MINLGPYRKFIFEPFSNWLVINMSTLLDVIVWKVHREQDSVCTDKRGR